MGIYIDDTRRGSGRLPKKGAGSKKPRGRASSLREALERATAGMYYTSESECPFRFFTLPPLNNPQGSPLAPLEFLACLGVSEPFIDEYDVPANKLVEERTIEEFFPTRTNIVEFHGTTEDDPTVVATWKRVEKLKALLRKRLRGVKVLRMGRVIVRCFVVGLTPSGELAGLVTEAVET